jgi:hypothetical protein
MPLYRLAGNKNAGNDDADKSGIGIDNLGKAAGDILLAKRDQGKGNDVIEAAHNQCCPPKTPITR